MGVAQLGLGLALKLGLGQLHRDDRGETLTAVLAGHLLLVLEDFHLLAVGVEHVGQGLLEAGLVHAALGGVDVVGEGHQNLVVGVGVLHGDLRDGVVLHAGHVDDAVVDGGLVLVDEGHKLPDAALIVHGVLLLHAGTAVLNDNLQSGVQEGLLPHAGMEDFVVIDRVLKHLGVGLEHHLGAVAVGLAHDGHALGDLATGELHLVDFAVLVDAHLQPLGQGVDHAGAHAVEAAGHLVAAAAELTAGVEDGEHNLQSGQAGLGLDIHGDAAAVVGDGDDVTLQNGHVDTVAVAGQGLVDGVVHDFVHQMVQARGGGGADIHTGPLAHRLQALQHLNLTAAVLVVHLSGALFQF